MGLGEMKCTLGPNVLFRRGFRAEDGREDLVRLRGGYDYLIYSSRLQTFLFGRDDSQPSWRVSRYQGSAKVAPVRSLPRVALRDEMRSGQQEPSAPKAFRVNKAHAVF